jgi:hypothetical protein
VNIPSLEPAKILELSPSNNILKNEYKEINMVQNKTDKTPKLIRLSEVKGKPGLAKRGFINLSAREIPQTNKNR